MTLKIDALNADEFRLFLKISPKQLLTNYIVFIVSYEKLTCGDTAYPFLSKSVKPKYPAAAKAVRAGGEVSVLVKIAPDGKVSSANGLSGHPLLRHASEVAAEQFEFEVSNEPTQREARLTFMFLPSQYEKPNLERLTCPYRPLITSEAAVIETTETRLN